jgi:hypothetical protein
VCVCVCVCACVCVCDERVVLISASVRAEWYKLQFLPALKRAEQHLHDSGGDLNAPRPPPKDSNVSISSTGGKPTLPSKQPPLSHPTPTADKGRYPSCRVTRILLNPSASDCDLMAHHGL